VKVRGTKASGTFSCDKKGSFELLVHMEADSHVASYAEFNFESLLPPSKARVLADTAAFILRHRTGLFIVCVHSAQNRNNPQFCTSWLEADAILARRGTWLLSTTVEQLRCEPKWTRARQLARCAHAEIDPLDQKRVIDYLSKVGIAPIRQCVKLCAASADSLDAIYKLVSSGILYLDSNGDLPLAGNLTLHPPATGAKNPSVSWL
jgi:hypothetical protein